jgi:hypothetical protein
MDCKEERRKAALQGGIAVAYKGDCVHQSNRDRAQLMVILSILISNLREPL